MDSGVCVFVDYNLGVLTCERTRFSPGAKWGYALLPVVLACGPQAPPPACSPVVPEAALQLSTNALHASVRCGRGLSRGFQAVAGNTPQSTSENLAPNHGGRSSPGTREGASAGMGQGPGLCVKEKAGMKQPRPRLAVSRPASARLPAARAPRASVSPGARELAWTAALAVMEAGDACGRRGPSREPAGGCRRPSGAKMPPPGQGVPGPRRELALGSLWSPWGVLVGSSWSPCGVLVPCGAPAQLSTGRLCSAH